MKEQSALHSSELKKVPADPSEPNDEVWQLMVQARSLKDQLEEFQEECQRKFCEQMGTLDGLMHWCDSLLYLSGRIYNGQAREEKTPEG